MTPNEPGDGGNPGDSDAENLGEGTGNKSDNDTAGVISAVFETVAAAAAVVRDGLASRRGSIDAENPSGERQLAADVWADRLLVERVAALDGVTAVASEERAEIERAVDADGLGLSVTLDPLDGSSNLESNNLMGTIVGVYEAPLPASGERLVAAAYVLYGPTTTMVAATERGVREYLLEDGSLRTVRDDVRLPEEPTVYGFGGRVPDWPEQVHDFVRTIESELKLRYGGAFVGDVNQVLNYGGVFAYPALRSSPEGKLRLQFEGAPVGYIIERAGGRSSDGTGSLLAVEPTGLHQRTPVYVGSDSVIDRLEAALED